MVYDIYIYIYVMCCVDDFVHVHMWSKLPTYIHVCRLLWISYTVNSPFRGHLSSGDPLFRGHLSSGDTSLQGTPLFWGHLTSGDPLLRGPSLQGTLSSGDTSLLGTPLFRDPLFRGPLFRGPSLQGTPHFWGHLLVAYFDI